jgi:Dirigent-like protein
MVSSIYQTVVFSIILFLSVNKACSDSAGEKNTHLHFYLQEILTGPNATKLQNVQAPNSTEFTFGAMSVIDDNLREGQDDNSTLIGN